jgi:hypothetical protein
MVVVTVALWPGGDEKRAKVLGIAQISNEGGTEQVGRYDVCLLKAGSPMGKGRRVWKRGQVVGFPRKRLGGWDLLYRALAAVVGDRNLGVMRPEHAEPIGIDQDAPGMEE